MAKNQHTEPFIMLPRKLLASRAWQALGINGRRFVDFLMIEHMRHGGRQNGFLVAPHRQLEEFGIGARLVSGAIEEAERLGLVDCRRGVGRRPSLFELTWLPPSDGAAPSNRFIGCDAEVGAVIAARKAAKRRTPLSKRAVVPTEGEALQMPHLCTKNASQREGTNTVVPVQREGITGGCKGEAPYRISYQDGAKGKVEKGKVGRNGCVGAPAASPSEVPAADGQTPEIADHSIPGKPNGKAHDMSAQREIAAVVPLRVRHGKEISK